MPNEYDPPPFTRMRHRVLIVEDHADSAELVAVFLRQGGHDVEEAGDAGVALGIASRFKPTIVLVDIVLPIVDGLVLARHMRSAVPRARMFVVSAQPIDSFVARAREVGIERCFAKPVNLSHLAAAIAK